jgi:hypothetical protein
MSENDNLPHGDHRCGAKNRKGNPCTAFSMKNGRCRFHGGLSTGPKTKEGKERSRRGNWKHGERSAAVLSMRREANRITREFKRWMKAGAIRNLQ